MTNFVKSLTHSLIHSDSHSAPTHYLSVFSSPPYLETLAALTYITRLNSWQCSFFSSCSHKNFLSHLQPGNSDRDSEWRSEGVLSPSAKIFLHCKSESETARNGTARWSWLDFTKLPWWVHISTTAAETSLGDPRGSRRWHTSVSTRQDSLQVWTLTPLITNVKALLVHSRVRVQNGGRLDFI